MKTTLPLKAFLLTRTIVVSEEKKPLHWEIALVCLTTLTLIRLMHLEEASHILFKCPWQVFDIPSNFIHKIEALC